MAKHSEFADFFSQRIAISNNYINSLFQSLRIEGGGAGGGPNAKTTGGEGEEGDKDNKDSNGIVVPSGNQ